MFEVRLTSEQGAAVERDMNQLWFTLDEIRAVAEAIPLMQQHAQAELIEDRIDALSRAIVVLCGQAVGVHDAIQAKFTRRHRATPDEAEQGD